jgi:hypothetical protein
MALQIFESDWRQLNEGAAKADRVVFYGAAVSSLLEVSINGYAASLREQFADETEIINWLEQTWEPDERAHSQAMRTYLARVWPQYGWGKAYAGFMKQYTRDESGATPQPLSPARAMLSRCITECEVALLYRNISTLATDPLAKMLFAQMYEDEIAHYQFLFHWFQILCDNENLSALSALDETASVAASRGDDEIGTALEHVRAGFVQPMPFPPMTPYTPSRARETVPHSPFTLATVRGQMLKPLRAAVTADQPLASAVDMYYQLGQRTVM